MPHVVVVDDEPAIRGLAARWLEAAGFQPREMADADTALAEVRNEPPDVVVTDLRMPGHDGFWLAEQVRRASPDTAVLMATACDDLPSAVKSLKLGVLDYLLKPFSCEELQAAVHRGVTWHANRMSSRLLSGALAVTPGQSGAPTAQALAQLSEQGSIDALVAMMGAYDRPLAAHAQRVAQLSVRLAEMLRIPDGDRLALHRAALLHEAAMVALPEDGLPDAQPRPGLEWLQGIPSLGDASAIVGSMREWCDGSGDPEGLRRDDIPIASRVLSVVDAFDESRYPRHRPVLPARSVRDALVLVNSQRGRRFDPDIIDALVKQQTVN